MDLKAPSLIQGNSARNTNMNHQTIVLTKRPKHVPNAPLLEKENKDIEKHKLKTFTQGPGQWSVKEKKTNTNSKKTREDKTEQDMDQSKATSENGWSFCKPNSSSGKSRLGQSKTNCPRTQEAKVSMKNINERNNEQGFLMKKSSSQNDLNFEPHSRNKNQKSRIKSSGSISSITSEVCFNKLTEYYNIFWQYFQVSRSRPPCVGILKTPGQRKMSSNRVEFLNNVREREIPSRHV